jgi:hypothetical protein
VNAPAQLPGVPDGIDHHRVITEMMRRACSLGFDTWWRRAGSVGFCANPIQLTGTDEFGRERIVWVRCNNRRATVCPSCSDLYARDTWQLVAAGTTGGRHNITPEVATRPQVFMTLTAPSFGAVHSSSGSKCRDHKKIGGDKRCPHGKPLWCSTIHEHTDARVGQPLCAECYDYLGHVLFTWHLPELWRRFTIALRRNLTKHLKSQGIVPGSVKASFVKVVEMQARAIPHIHALIRLDPPEGHGSTATDGSSDHNITVPPPHVVVGSAVRRPAPPGSRRYLPPNSPPLSSRLPAPSPSTSSTPTPTANPTTPTSLTTLRRHWWSGSARRSIPSH